MEEWIRERMPRVLPVPWRLESEGEDGAKWIRRRDGGWQSVILSGAVEDDGKRWLHISTALAHRLPTWEELREVKEIWIGRDLYAVQVLPPAAFYVDIHSYVLHLFACVDEYPIPEFSGFRPDIIEGRTL